MTPEAQSSAGTSMAATPRWRWALGESLRHALALLLLGVLGIVFTNPLSRRLACCVLGDGAGDNLASVWNFWWAQIALVQGDYYRTPYLFAPLGTSLVLHTSTPLLGILAALVSPGARPVAAYNVAVVSAVALNAACAYGAAFTLTRDRLASFFAGVTFGGAPFLIVRVAGHLNVLSAWGLPLLVIAATCYRRQPTRPRAIALAASIGCLGYLDYYALVFGVVLLVNFFALSWWTIEVRARPVTPWRRRVLAYCGTGIAALALVGVWIELTGGLEMTIGGVLLTMRESFNPRVAAGLLMLAAWIAWKWPVFVKSPAPDRNALVVSRLPWVLGTVTLLFIPLAIATARLWAAGDYVPAEHHWRSAPAGVDLASLAFGNPLHPILGQLTTALYQRFHINQIESSAWIGVAPLVLCVMAIARCSALELRRWIWIGGFFLVWSLGPYLMVLGHNTGLMLPQTLVQFLPVVANARMPGRAFVVVQLAVALIGAMVLAERRRSRGGTALALIASAAVAVDYWPGPHRLLTLDEPAVYQSLKALPPGAVLHVPFGIRDGSGEHGRLDHLDLYYQTLHGQPMVGGFVARLSGRIRLAYETDPIIGPALTLSEGKPPQSGQADCRASVACSIRYVVVNRGTASPALAAFVESAFVLHLIERDGERTLYSVEGLRSCRCEPARQ